MDIAARGLLAKTNTIILVTFITHTVYGMTPHFFQRERCYRVLIIRDPRLVGGSFLLKVCHTKPLQTNQKEEDKFWTYNDAQTESMEQVLHPWRDLVGFQNNADQDALSNHMFRCISPIVAKSLQAQI